MLRIVGWRSRIRNKLIPDPVVKNPDPRFRIRITLYWLVGMASKIALPDTVGKVGSFSKLKAPGSELTGQARLLTGQPAQRAGKEGVPARPTLPQLLPEQRHVTVTFFLFFMLCTLYLLRSLCLTYPKRFLFLREKQAFYIFIPIQMSG